MSVMPRHKMEVNTGNATKAFDIAHARHESM
jgi:hypothetical protein